MALASHSSYQVEKGIADPVQDKEHFHLLPEMNFFMANKLCLVVGLTGDPDENEKR